MPFIQAAGLKAVVIRENGEIQPFFFNPNLCRSNSDKLYRDAPRMYLFILGATPEIVDEAVSLVTTQKNGHSWLSARETPIFACEREAAVGS